MPADQGGGDGGGDTKKGQTGRCDNWAATAKRRLGRLPGTCRRRRKRAGESWLLPVGGDGDANRATRGRRATRLAGFAAASQTRHPTGTTKSHSRMMPTRGRRATRLAGFAAASQTRHPTATPTTPRRRGTAGEGLEGFPTPSRPRTTARWWGGFRGALGGQPSPLNAN